MKNKQNELTLDVKKNVNEQLVNIRNNFGTDILIMLAVNKKNEISILEVRTRGFPAGNEDEYQDVSYIS